MWVYGGKGALWVLLRCAGHGFFPPLRHIARKKGGGRVEAYSALFNTRDNIARFVCAA